MTETQWEGLASLVIDKPKMGEFLDSLKNEEGEFVSLEDGLPTFKKALKTRLDSRRDWGLSQRSKEIESFLAEKFKVDPKEGRLEDLIEGLVKNSSNQNKKMTAEELAELPEVKQMLAAASKHEITPESLKGNPVVAEMIRNAVTLKEKELTPVVEKLQSEIQAIRRAEETARMQAWVSSFTDDAKLAIGEDEGDKKTAIDIITTLINAKLPNVKWVEGDPVPTDNNGNPLTDEMGFPVPFREAVMKVIPYKPRKYPAGHQNSPTPPSGGQGGKDKKHNFQGMDEKAVFDEYYKIRSKSPKEAAAFMQAYDEHLAAASK